jgi:methionine--tRNA ligase beta chain
LESNNIASPVKKVLPMSNKKEMISFGDFEKVELQVGKIINVERLNGYNKILKITVDLGDEKREIMSGIAKHYSQEELVDKSVIVCTNLEPKKFGENTSNGMILAAEKGKKPILLTVFEEVEPGSPIL